MQVTVRVPSALRRFAGDQSSVPLELRDGGAATLAEVLAALRQAHPGVYERALNERGEIRQHMNVFLNAENVKQNGGLRAAVSAGDEVWIIPAVSGG